MSTQPIEVRTLTDYIRVVEPLAEQIMSAADDFGGSHLWFRGCASATWVLTPSLLRHRKATDARAMLQMERRLLNRFADRSLPFQSPPMTLSDERSNWEYLFLMQHHGVPTRLLDWSENAFIALFFAVTDGLSRRALDQTLTQVPAAVWILDPVTWNRSVLRDAAYRGGILGLDDRALVPYGPQADIGGMQPSPVAMYGIHNSPRIVAQRGVFTIFGKSLESMEDHAKRLGLDGTALSRVEIPADALTDLLERMMTVGYADSMLYPDLTGLATELKREVGFDG